MSEKGKERGIEDTPGPSRGGRAIRRASRRVFESEKSLKKEGKRSEFQGIAEVWSLLAESAEAMPATEELVWAATLFQGAGSEKALAAAFGKMDGTEERWTGRRLRVFAFETESLWLLAKFDHADQRMRWSRKAKGGGERSEELEAPDREELRAGFREAAWRMAKSAPVMSRQFEALAPEWFSGLREEMRAREESIFLESGVEEKSEHRRRPGL